MRIDLINYIQREDIKEFRNTVIKRKWDMLIFVTGGEYSIRLENKAKPTVLKQGDIFFVGAETELTREILLPVSFYHLAFYSEVEHPFYKSMSSGKISLPSEQQESLFKSLKYASLLPNNNELITHIIERAFVEQYLFCKSKKQNLKPFSDDITSAINYMKRNLEKKIDIDELAAMVYLSHSGLIWKFNKEVGTTPSQYLNLLRLGYSKQLLLNHSYSITEISEMCGYSNPFYFTNQFRKYTGMSPSKFREYHLKKDV